MIGIIHHIQLLALNTEKVYFIMSNLSIYIFNHRTELIVVLLARILLKKCVHLAVTDELKYFLEKHHNINYVLTVCDFPTRRNTALQHEEVWTLRNKYFGKGYEDKLLIVTSTSYTKDEPLQYLVQALETLSQEQKDIQIVCIVTGKGILKADFKEMFNKSLRLRYELHQIWVEKPIDYIELLSCCDLGMSFHCSTSGLDFPMKIVDMISAGIPTCSIEYEAMQRAEKDLHIKLFKNSDELSKIILDAKIQNSKLPYTGLYWEDASSIIKTFLA